MGHKKFAFVFPGAMGVSFGKCYSWTSERKGSVSDMFDRTGMI